jgi:hypothetical protein
MNKYGIDQQYIIDQERVRMLWLMDYSENEGRYIYTARRPL